MCDGHCPCYRECVRVVTDAAFFSSCRLRSFFSCVVLLLQQTVCVEVLLYKALSPLKTILLCLTSAERLTVSVSAGQAVSCVVCVAGVPSTVSAAMNASWWDKKTPAELTAAKPTRLLTKKRNYAHTTSRAMSRDPFFVRILHAAGAHSWGLWHHPAYFVFLPLLGNQSHTLPTIVGVHLLTLFTQKKTLNKVCAFCLNPKNPQSATFMSQVRPPDVGVTSLNAGGTHAVAYNECRTQNNTAGGGKGKCSAPWCSLPSVTH